MKEINEILPLRAQQHLLTLMSKCETRKNHTQENRCYMLTSDQQSARRTNSANTVYGGIASKVSVEARAEHCVCNISHRYVCCARSWAWYGRGLKALASLSPIWPTTPTGGLLHVGYIM